MALQIGASKEMLDKSIASLKAIFDAPDYKTWALGFRDQAGNRYAAEAGKKAAAPLTQQATGILQSAAANPLAQPQGGAAAILGNTPKPWAGGSMLADIQAKPMQQTAAQLEQAARNAALAQFQGLSVDEYLKGLASGKYVANNAMPGFSLEGIITDEIDTPEQFYNAIKAAGPEAVDALLRQQYAEFLSQEANPFGLPQLAVAIGGAGTLAGAANALGGGNLFGENPLSGLLGGGGNANAVPGLSTGVTTPAGGAAIVGTGQAAPLTGLLGGAPLGASPLAVAGGAAALPGVSPLPTGGTLPGTNITVGTPGNQSWLDQALGRIQDNLTDPQNIGQRIATNIGSNLLQTALAPEATGGAGGGLLGNAGQGFAPRPWPGNPYPGEILKIPAYMRGLLAAQMGGRMG